MREMSASNENPLVSVGVPTFNRPKGLERTLECLLAQSYRNIEVIISDNCSSDELVQQILNKYKNQDKRVSFVIQKENLGAWLNFKFVLEQATGKYFMWAADDDEWDPFFIETCVLGGDGSVSVMTGFDTVFRGSGKIQNNPLPDLSNEKNTYANAVAFLNNMQPSMFYGLHNRLELLSAFDEAAAIQIDRFDFLDCYMVFRMIIKTGFRTVPQKVLYHAGVDTPDYEIKKVRGQSTKLNYYPFLSNSIKLVLFSQKLDFVEKIILSGKVISLVYSLYRHHRNR